MITTTDGRVNHKGKMPHHDIQTLENQFLINNYNSNHNRQAHHDVQNLEIRS